MFARVTSLVVMLLVSFSSLAASPYDLVGTFSAIGKGKMTEVEKIEKRENQYMLFTKKQGAWKESKKPLEVVTPEQFEKMLKAPQPSDAVGLSSKVIAVFKVNKGWGKGKFKTDTGYFMLLIFGPVELHKS